MNTRQPIQPPDAPAVLSIACSTSRKRFVAGLSDGLKVFRSDNCLTTFNPSLPPGCGAAVTAVHNDRYLAFVPSRKTHGVGGPNHFHFWDMIRGREVARFDLYEPIRGLKINGQFLVVILESRTVVFQYQALSGRADLKTQSHTAPGDAVLAPNRPHSLHSTSSNIFALACLHDALLVLPAQSPGQVQLITLEPEIDRSTKRVLRAHKSTIRCMALSPDGSLLATASEQGTLLRIFRTSNLDQIFEFRRGLDAAIIYNIAFSPESQWLACTSDKGTLHIFKLQSVESKETAARPSSSSPSQVRQHRKPHIQAHRSSTGAFIPPPSVSNLSYAAPSITPSTAAAHVTSATAAGSIQEYYHLMPHQSPSSVASSTAVSRGISGPALRPSPFTPRILSDTRSSASSPFHVGDDPLHWQSMGTGATSLYTWTTAPDGGRKRIKKPTRPLPNDPTGRPPKGLIIFDSEEAIFVVGGGRDARWERFEISGLLLDDGRLEWKLNNVGFRKYLGKQYVD